MPRRRFGVSLPEDIARALDSIAETLGVARSSIVEEAIRAYIADAEHLAQPHRCVGVIIAVCSERSTLSVLEEHRSVVVGHMHAHPDGRCADIIVVAGMSRDIARLVSHLKSRGCGTRYIPLVHG